MKTKIIDFLKKTWWIALVILLFASIIFVSKCTSKKEDSTITQLELKSALIKQKSELDTKYLEDKTAIYDSLQQDKELQAKQHDSKADKLNKNGSKQDAEIHTAQTNYDNSNQKTPLCDSLVNKQQNRIDSLKVENNEVRNSNSDIKSALTDCDTQKSIKDSVITKLTQSFNEEIEVNSSLQKVSKRTLVEKHGIAIGAGLTAVIIAIIKFAL